MATVAGGKAMRCAGLGTLAPGAPADLVLHDLRAPSWIPLNDPATQLVFGGSGATVDTVIVDGKLIVEGGRIVAFDMEPILAEVRGLVQRQRNRAPDLQRWAARMEELVP
jgi:cytosine/adenosine deaminase-related metal-dependent hydrolase